MRAWLERGRAARLLLAVLTCLALLPLAGQGRAQEATEPVAQEAAADAAPAPTADERRASFERDYKAAITEAQELLKAPNVDGGTLEVMRDRLLGLRARTLDEVRADQSALDDANKRVEALGPAPADGAGEAPELAKHREELAKAVADAQLPLLRAQEAAGVIEQLMKDLDHEIWRRLTVELRALGPTPLSPANWGEAWEALSETADQFGQTATQAARDAQAKNIVTNTLPRSLAIIVFGVALTIILRYRLTRWTEDRLGQAKSPRVIAWLVALRNIARLLVPAVGAALTFAAFDPALLYGGTVQLFRLPPFVLVLIGAGWLASSVFSPRLPQYRLVPLSDAEARRGARLSHLLGGVLSAHYLIVNHIGALLLTPAANAVLHFPLTLLGGWGLWRVAAVFARVQRNIAARDENLPPDQRTSTLGLNLLAFLERAVWLIGVATPILAGIGFFAASQALLYPMILTLGLFGANLVLFDLFSKTGRGLVSRPDRPPSESGLGPVILVALLVCLSGPLLALIWGGRTSDLGSAWLMLREGGSLGGIHLSIGIIASFVAVFLIGFVLTRAAQSVLVSSVLPRTRLDQGGKTAVLSGVSYVGYAIATLAAVSATGIDLSSIAIVAGALSVGIGFGLQTIVSNFVSGIILLVERPVKEGDWIEVGGFSGHVRRIRVRATEIETFDRASVILPNSDLISGTVLNRTHSGMTGRIQIPVSVTYDSDPARVAASLLAVAEDHPMVLRDPAPRVLLMNLGPDSMDFEIRVWLRDINFSLSARSDINFAVMERLNRESIRVRFWGRELPPEPHRETPPLQMSEIIETPPLPTEDAMETPPLAVAKGQAKAGA